MIYFKPFGVLTFKILIGLFISYWYLFYTTSRRWQARQGFCFPDRVSDVQGKPIRTTLEICFSAFFMASLCPRLSKRLRLAPKTSILSVLPVLSIFKSHESNSRLRYISLHWDQSTRFYINHVHVSQCMFYSTAHAAALCRRCTIVECCTRQCLVYCDRPCINCCLLMYVPRRSR